MTVPPDYKFPDLPRSVLLRQIGNMVPPLGWKPFVNSVAEFRRAFYAGKIDVTGRTINDAALTIVPTTTNATALNMRAQLGMPDRPQEAGLTRRMRQLSVSDDSSHTMSPDPLSDDEVQRSQFRQHSTQTEKSQSDKTQYWDLTLMEDD